MTTSQNHRYREIANRLLSEIRSGKYAVGDRIPTEHAISREFGVSRNTARHAVQELERLGLIKRQRGSGTVVVKTDPRSTFASSITSISDLIQYAASTRIVVQRIRPALALPSIEGIPTAKNPQDWAHVEGVRYAPDSDAPICSTDIFLHPDVAEIAPTIGIEPIPVYRLIEERYDLLTHSITQTIDAVIISSHVAHDLQVRDGSAGLKVMRAYNDFSNRTLEITVNIYPAQQLTYRMTILRNTEGTDIP